MRKIGGECSKEAAIHSLYSQLSKEGIDFEESLGWKPSMKERPPCKKKTDRKLAAPPHTEVGGSSTSCGSCLSCLCGRSSSFFSSTCSRKRVGTSHSMVGDYEILHRMYERSMNKGRHLSPRKWALLPLAHGWNPKRQGLWLYIFDARSKEFAKDSLH